jgi:hypothetical protein
MSGSQADGYTIDLEFVKAMLQEFKEQKLIHKRFAYEIMMKALELFRQQPALVDIPVPDDGHFTVGEGTVVAVGLGSTSWEALLALAPCVRTSAMRQDEHHADMRKALS